MAGKEKFHGGHFPKCIVLQAVFCYLRYSLIYRDIEDLMRERGVEIDHATVQRYGLLNIRQVKYLNNIVEAGPSRHKANNQFHARLQII